ncbi:MAG: hypothetical protein CSA50_07710 [Gammaproteobacteria bacterium]|nr:MAG: hypothetical protein CSA50_07710 [Gammaproteobacteria bacterium]
MKIEQNSIVKLRQQQYCPVIQFWGEFELIGLYPVHFPPPLSDLLKGKKAGDQFNCQMVLPKTQYKESLVIKTTVAHLNTEADLKKGMVFTTRFNNVTLRGTLKHVDSENVYIDCNYPYIGLTTLNLSNLIIDVRQPSKEELEHRKNQKSAAISIVMNP